MNGTARARVRCGVLLADKLVIFGVRPYPEPLGAAFHIVGKRPVSLADPNRPDGSDPLEMK